MHVIEVRRDGENVAGAMGRMRAWLDDHQIAPRLFRLDEDAFRLEFEAESQAAAFADAFCRSLDQRIGHDCRSTKKPTRDEARAAGVV